jgi:hypothetical protein
MRTTLTRCSSRTPDVGRSWRATPSNRPFQNLAQGLAMQFMASARTRVSRPLHCRTADSDGQNHETKTRGRQKKDKERRLF